ncbi:ROK family protein [Paenibacillus dokdonensis]|uniref:ROK family protein n=1 Tax=Paenibacillus dokdonensis TaxID=2567944 RepID=A0ABU6GH09_9BACL|nr:ROK family protein [Paenibacillus dokdonensis]MEC0238723.1 ROK family protein [Paenibacillus dokdonensis]
MMTIVVNTTLEKENRAVIGVDLGGTKIATGMLDQSGSLLARSQKATAGLKSADEVISTIVDTINEVRGEQDIAGVGVASPGMVDSKNGIISNGVNLPDWDGISLQSELEKRLGISVRLINDANAAAWGEYVYGAGRGSQSMVYVTLSTGIGSGLVLDGRLFTGSSSFAGELGHTVINPAGIQCGCGQRGCWETYSSGTAIARLAREAIAEAGIETHMTMLAEAEGVPLSAKHVFQAAGQGDQVAAETLEQVIHYTGLGLMNIIHSFNPDRIVIGGGVSRAGNAFFEPLIRKTEELILEPYRGTCTIKPAELRDDVGIIGAAALFVD